MKGITADLVETDEIIFSSVHKSTLGSFSILLTDVVRCHKCEEKEQTKSLHFFRHRGVYLCQL